MRKVEKGTCDKLFIFYTYIYVIWCGGRGCRHTHATGSVYRLCVYDVGVGL